MNMSHSMNLNGGAGGSGSHILSHIPIGGPGTPGSSNSASNNNNGNNNNSNNNNNGESSSLAGALSGSSSSRSNNGTPSHHSYRAGSTARDVYAHLPASARGVFESSLPPRTRGRPSKARQQAEQAEREAYRRIENAQRAAQGLSPLQGTPTPPPTVRSKKETPHPQLQSAGSLLMHGESSSSGNTGALQMQEPESQDPMQSTLRAVQQLRQDLASVANSVSTLSSALMLLQGTLQTATQHTLSHDDAAAVRAAQTQAAARAAVEMQQQQQRMQQHGGVVSPLELHHQAQQLGNSSPASSSATAHQQQQRSLNNSNNMPPPANPFASSSSSLLAPSSSSSASLLDTSVGTHESHGALQKLSRKVKTVQDVWDEYWNGFDGGRPLRELEAQYGAEWCGGAHASQRKLFLRRLKIARHVACEPEHRRAAKIQELTHLQGPSTLDWLGKHLDAQAAVASRQG